MTTSFQMEFKKKLLADALKSFGVTPDHWMESVVLVAWDIGERPDWVFDMSGQRFLSVFESLSATEWRE